MQLAKLVGKFSVTTGRQPVISGLIPEFTSLPAALQEQLLSDALALAGTSETVLHLTFRQRVFRLEDHHSCISY